MKKRLLMAVGLLSLYVAPFHAITSYFRTPLSFIESRWGTVHYPLPWIDSCANWEIDTLGLVYERNACRAFGINPDCVINDACDTACDRNNKVTRNTVSLSQLWFGQESFLASDVFAGQIPFGSLIKITPNFSYNETGATLAFNVVRKRLGCDRTWFVGGRVAMPISVVEVNQRNAGAIAVATEDIANVVLTIGQQYNANSGSTAGGSADSRQVKAYRLDFLSSLQMPDGTPMVQYGTVGTDASSDTFVAGQDITTNTDQSQAGSSPNRAPMYVYKQANGVFPLAAKGLNASTALYPLTATGQRAYPMVDIEADAILAAGGGAALADGQLGAFGGFNSAPGSDNLQVDYAGNLALDVNAQKQLFLFPVSASSSGSTWEPIGLLVEDTIEYVLDALQNANASPSDVIINFFRDNGIDFESSDCSTGAGDTFLQFYGGKMCDCWFADGLIGFRLPTGTDADNPKRIYQQTTGNNGHFATKLGVEGGYMPCNWFGVKLDFFWSRNFSRNEKRAAAFTGATTRNIGPCADARVQWNDFQAHVDFTFFNPKCADLGWDFGYEFYAKTDDKICFCATQAFDFNGNQKFLDSSLLKKDTNTQSHKLRVELFNRWGCMELFLGGSYIIAGRQVMKEAECHLGMKAYF